MTIEMTPPASPGEACTRRPGARDTKCRCSAECITLQTRARRARAERAGRGNTGRYSAEAVTRHIRGLLAAAPGATNADVARASGISSRAIRYLLGQEGGVRRPSVYMKTAIRILSIHALPTTAGVSPTVARRMVEALAVQGWSRPDIAQRAGMKPGTLAPTNSRTLSPATCSAIARTFLALRYEKGANARSITYGKRRGYVPWAAWTPEISADSAHADVADIHDPAWKAAITERLARGEWPLAR